MIRPVPPSGLCGIVLVLFFCSPGAAADDSSPAVALVSAAEDDSTKVTVTVVLPKQLATFEGRVLELRLYEYDPFLADAAADLVDKVQKVDFAHAQGQVTEIKTEIGAEGKVKPRRKYYLTTFVLDGKQRTHIGERDGKPGLCKVITDGQPRQVRVIVRAVR